MKVQRSIDNFSTKQQNTLGINATNYRGSFDQDNIEKCWGPTGTSFEG